MGGPLQPIFGAGIFDVPVKTTLWRGLLSHTHYWHEDRQGSRHVGLLRAALNLLDDSSLDIAATHRPSANSAAAAALDERRA